MDQDAREPLFIGRGEGRMTHSEGPTTGDARATLAGNGDLTGTSVTSAGVVTYRGTRRQFRGMLDLVFTDAQGLHLARWAGSHVGRHTDLCGSALLCAVGSFQCYAPASPRLRDVLRSRFTVAEVEVRNGQSFVYRISLVRGRALPDLGPLVGIGAERTALASHR